MPGMCWNCARSSPSAAGSPTRASSASIIPTPAFQGPRHSPAATCASTSIRGIPAVSADRVLQASVPVGSSQFSVQWTGQVVPNFTETYSFSITSNDGARLYIRPTGATSWTTLINDWNSRTTKVDSGSYALVAGQSYDIEIQYRDVTGAAVIQLAWSSPSTPREVIDPLSDTGINAVTYVDEMFADAMKSARAEWGDPNSYFTMPTVPADANVGPWPTQRRSSGKAGTRAV